MGPALASLYREQDERDPPVFDRAWKFFSHDGEWVGRYAWIDEDHLPLFRAVKKSKAAHSHPPASLPDEKVGPLYGFLPAQALESSTPLNDAEEVVLISWQVIGEDGLRYASRSGNQDFSAPVESRYPVLSSETKLQDLVAMNLIRVPEARENVIGLIGKGEFRQLLERLESENEAGYTVAQLLFAISIHPRCQTQLP